MSDTNVAPGGGEGIATPPVITPADTNATFSDAHAAGKALAAARWKRENPNTTEETSPEPAAPEAAAAPPQESEAQAEDDAQPTADPVEPTEADPAPEPSVDPPRSWTKDAKEAFKLLPPALQKDVAELERSREVEVRRGQNEVAEKLKGITAKEQAAEQLRLQYEAALPALQQAIQAAQSGEFADIKTQEDVDKLANEDWPRYARWQNHRDKINAIHNEAKAAHERQVSEYRAKWSQFATSEDLKALEKIPELADKAKASKVADAAMATLEGVGFTRDEFAKAWMGEASISPRDHRWQQIVWKAAQFDQVKANAAKPAPKAVPNVQRPGVSKAPTSANDAQIQTLEKAFERKPNAQNAAALLNAKRRTA